MGLGSYPEPSGAVLGTQVGLTRGQRTDVAIRAWIRSGGRFKEHSSACALVSIWRPERSAPSWTPRSRFTGTSPGNGPGQSHAKYLGSFTDLPLAAAGQSAKELRAKIALDHDAASEKQGRKSTALASRWTSRCRPWL